MTGFELLQDSFCFGCRLAVPLQILEEPALAFQGLLALDHRCRERIDLFHATAKAKAAKGGMTSLRRSHRHVIGTGAPGEQSARKETAERSLSMAAMQTCRAVRLRRRLAFRRVEEPAHCAR